VTALLSPDAIDARSTTRERHAQNDWAWLCAVLGLAILAIISGAFVTVLDGDSADYAVIAKTMVSHHDFVNLMENGRDNLDKPHLSFWLAAISFEIFGISTWSYKLPGILLSGAAALYTFALAKLLYNRDVAIVAAIVLLTAVHMIVSANDVRMEAYLTAFVIGAVYHFYRASKFGSNLQLVAGSLFTAFAMMTKGPFAIIPIGGAISGGLALGSQWEQLFHLRWLIAALLLCIFITPELYCLWMQFDLHPEKVVSGRMGVSGLRYFFIDSQFGRFFSTNSRTSSRLHYFYFFGVILWAFLPWSITFYRAAFEIISKFATRQPQTADYFTMCGGLVTILLFNASQYQYDHYLTIAFPFMAIMTAAYGLTTQAGLRWATVGTWILVGAILATCAALQWLVQPDSWLEPVVLLGCAIVLLFFLQRREWERATFRLTAVIAVAVIFADLYLNVFVLPSLTKYQAGSEMARYLNEYYPGQHVVQVGNDYSSFEFYLQAPLSRIDVNALLDGRLPQGVLAYGPAIEFRPLRDKLQVLHQTENYQLSHPRLKFLDAASRGSVLEEFWLVRSQGS
jgi:Dolichyl-phosphate-mannose-protein mannosyltransferase